MQLTGQGREKFATYTRSSSNGLDYAINRWYDSVHGHFITPDPHIASMDLSNPATMNRYAYVGGDPVNTTDPTGQMSVADNCLTIVCTLDGDTAGDYGMGPGFGTVAVAQGPGQAPYDPPALWSLDVGYTPTVNLSRLLKIA